MSCTLCGVKICRRQYRDSDYIECNTGRILIENVTQIDTTEDEWALKSLRRICTGKTTKCDVHQICQDPRIQNLRVTYTCNDRKCHNYYIHYRYCDDISMLYDKSTECVK